MEITKDFIEKVMAASRAEQESLRVRHIRQESVIAFCEVLLERLRKDQEGDD